MSTDDIRWPYDFGFGDPIDVRGRYSVAEQFPKSRGRCGIYLLEFTSSLFYIGQAVDVVRRFAQHQHNHHDIVRLRFQHVNASNLNAVEQELIHRAEALGVRLTNVIFISVVQGEKDLDLLITPAEQAMWLDDPASLALDDARHPLNEDDVRRLRLRKQYCKLEEKTVFEPLLDLLRRYVNLVLPAPVRTELSHWSVSCLPSTNKSYAPRLAVINVYKMETLVVCFDKADPQRIWGFVNMARTPLQTKRLGLLRARYRWFRDERVMLRKPHYRSAGPDKLQAHFNSFAQAHTLLDDPVIQRAMRQLTLNLMRKGPNLQIRWHCYDLADQILAPGQTAQN